MSNRASLATALEPWIEKPLSELPPQLRARIERDFPPVTWDRMTASQRRGLALRADLQRDPEANGSQVLWDEFFVRKRTLQAQLEQWRSIPTPTARDLALQEERLKALESELARMERLQQDARGDDPRRGTTSLELRRFLGPGSSSGGDVPARDNEQTRPEDPCAEFRAMNSLRPDELSLAFVGGKGESGLTANNLLEVSGRGVTRRIPLAALDLVDRRRGTLSRPGAVLLGMAQDKRLPRVEKNVRLVSRLRGLFRKHLGIQSDPFEPYRENAGWIPRFRVLDKRGTADERARQAAERRTTLLNDNRAAHNCPCDDVEPEDRLEEEADLQRGGKRHDNSGCPPHGRGPSGPMEHGPDAADEWLRDNDPDHAS